jgi:hypothetical protein
MPTTTTSVNFGVQRWHNTLVVWHNELKNAKTRS